MEAAVSEWLRGQGLLELAPALTSIGVASLERVSTLTDELCAKVRPRLSPCYLFFPSWIQSCVRGASQSATGPLMLLVASAFAVMPHAPLHEHPRRHKFHNYFL